MIIARLNRIREDESKNSDGGRYERPWDSFYAARREEDTFPDASLLDTLDQGQPQNIRTPVEEMAECARDNGLRKESEAELGELVHSRLDLSCLSFPAGPPAWMSPLTLDLNSESRPTKVRFRNYFREQRKFLAVIVKKLARSGTAYPTPTSAWACTPLLVPKARTAPF